ncbi:MAG: hypothetical protein WCL14_09765 [Bacteroidota bacterium]
MKNQDHSLRSIVHLIGLLFFSSLSYLAYVYYKERILSFDPAYLSFLMIETKTYAIACGRWGAVFSQFLPLMFLKAHCSLETFLRCYSVSFILVYYAVFLIITMVFRNYKAALALMLALCLGFRWVFYYPSAELYFGIALTALFWAVIAPVNPYSSKAKQWVATCFAIVLIYTESYCQQLTLFILLFVIMFEMIANYRWKDVHLWIVFAFCCSWYFIRMKFLSNSSYEIARMDQQDDMLFYLPDFFSLKSWFYLKSFFLSSLKSLSITFIVCLFILIRRKQWLLLLYVLSFFVGVFSFIVLIHAMGVDELFMQSYSTLLGFMVAIIILFLIYDRFPKGLVLLVVSVLLVINVRGIEKAHLIQTERLRYVARLTDYAHKMNARKCVISTRNIPHDIAFFSQFLAFETLLYSSIPSQDNAVTIFPVDDYANVDSLLNRKNIFIGTPWDPTAYTSNNIKWDFYKLPSTGYLKLNTPQSDSSFNESLFNDKNIFISPLNEEIHSGVYNFVVAPIRIINTSGKVLSSTLNSLHPVYLSYHVYDRSGNLLSWDNANTTLEVDIDKDYTQGLFIYLPKKNGTYIIEVDFKTEGIRWWNTKTRLRLIKD